TSKNPSERPSTYPTFRNLKIRPPQELPLQFKWLPDETAEPTRYCRLSQLLYRTLNYKEILHPHSHSIVLSDRNALNLGRKFFRHTMKNRLPDPSEFALLNSKENFSDYRHQLVDFRHSLAVPSRLAPSAKRPSRVTSA